MRPSAPNTPSAGRTYPPHTRAAALVMIATVPLVLLAWLFKTPGWSLAAGIALLAYLALTWADLRRSTRRAVGAMLIIGWSALLITGADPVSLAARLSDNAVVGVLIVACGMLAVPAASPRYVAELSRLVSGASGRRPPLSRLALVFWTGHLLGALLNISALSVLLPALGGARARDNRLMRSLHRGFALAGFWSPFYATVAIVLIAYPGRDGVACWSPPCLFCQSPSCSTWPRHSAMAARRSPARWCRPPTRHARPTPPRPKPGMQPPPANAVRRCGWQPAASPALVSGWTW
ncbi:hypothetical protein ACFQ4K_19730 [Tistrella bauzanensis]